VGEATEEVTCKKALSFVSIQPRSVYKVRLEMLCCRYVAHLFSNVEESYAANRVLGEIAIPALTVVGTTAAL
jgi:hypothetical protein